jgi:hypothetical protein
MKAEHKAVPQAVPLVALQYAALVARPAANKRLKEQGFLL